MRPHDTCWLDSGDARSIPAVTTCWRLSLIPDVQSTALSLRDVSNERALEVRSGIHFGEVESVEDNDIGGIVVHIGARVAGAANPGEVLVSRTVADLLVGSGVKLTDRGLKKLKGVDGRWQLFEVRRN